MSTGLRHPLIQRAVKYGLVGATTNLALFGFYLLLVEALDIRPIFATTITYATGIALTYIGNALWAFKSEQSHAYSAPRYIVAYLLGYAVQTSVLLGLIEVVHAPHFIAQLVGMGAAAGSIFTLLNIWVFASRQQTASEAKPD